MQSKTIVTMFFSFTILFILLFCNSSIYGIINIEEKRKKCKNDGLSGNFEFNIVNRTGNVEKIDIATGIMLHYKHLKNMLLFYGTYDFEETKTPYVNKETAHLRYNYDILDWLIGETFIQHQYDEFLLLNSRALVGIGPRFRICSIGFFELFYGTSYMYEEETLKDNGTVVDDLHRRYNRWNNYLSFWFKLDEKISLFSTTYVQPLFDRFEDIRLLNNSSLVFKLTKVLSFKLAFELKYDNEPIKFIKDAQGNPVNEIKKLDTSLDTSLIINF